MKNNSSISEEELEYYFAQYCAHRYHGYDKESFSACDYAILEDLAKDNPEAQKKLQAAEARGWWLWETVLKNTTLGLKTILPPKQKGGDPVIIVPSKCNAALLKFMAKAKLRNQYGNAPKTYVEAEVSEQVISTPFQIINSENHSEMIDLNICADPAQRETNRSI